MRAVVPLLIVSLGLTALGCGSSGGPVSVPTYKPDEMASEAMKQLDKNKNSSIEGSELDACPGLKAALSSFDGNNDKKLSEDELRARFESYRSGGAGAVGFTIRLTLDGTPLTDATVTLTPEPFMGGAVKEAKGQSGADGSISNYSVGSENLPGVAPGIYRVSVTKDGVNIPARYNSQTTLGCEVPGGGRGGNAVFEAKMTSR
jgi:hypothetical protein